ncbi:DUF2589 domain-containing protein [uncultured Dokdonia sp.]|uniref:DUF2589 domain-containing protein n=1 Tax=uncultured Dokdonia sp. TaxID=575653 RepID=UPI00261757F0|nr:DUF2589 domain-containing protein [uncultured Dokdonia sp.]
MIKFKELVESINEAAKQANQNIADNERKIIKDFFDYDPETKKYTAKTFNIDYPSTTVDGKVESVDIKVPLITMVPINSSAIDELKFTTTLDIDIKNDELMVSFSSGTSASKSGAFSEKNEPLATAKLEIIIRPHEPSEWLSKLISGYEKILRAQIPG